MRVLAHKSWNVRKGILIEFVKNFAQDFSASAFPKQAR